MAKSIADSLFSVLNPIEMRDSVLYEVVDLNKYIPAMPDASFQSVLGSRKSLKRPSEPNSLNKEIDSAIKPKRVSNLENSKLSEKEQLIARKEELTASNNRKLAKIAELKKNISDLQPKLGYSRYINGSFDTEDKDVIFWKEKYQDIHEQYEKMRKELKEKGAITRKSTNMLRQIPAPKI